MRTYRAKLKYTSRAHRDLDACRNFLREKPGGQPLVRVREILSAIRFIQDHPLLYPVVGRSPSGLELRRRKAGQFVILYVYFAPAPREPDGVVSIRAIPHASRQDVFWGVNERVENNNERGEPPFIFMQ